VLEDGSDVVVFSEPGLSEPVAAEERRSWFRQRD